MIDGRNHFIYYLNCSLITGVPANRTRTLLWAFGSLSNAICIQVDCCTQTGKTILMRLVFHGHSWKVTLILLSHAVRPLVETVLLKQVNALPFGMQGLRSSLSTTTNLVTAWLAPASTILFLIGFAHNDSDKKMEYCPRMKKSNSIALDLYGTTSINPSLNRYGKTITCDSKHLEKSTPTVWSTISTVLIERYSVLFYRSLLQEISAPAPREEGWLRYTANLDEKNS